MVKNISGTILLFTKDSRDKKVWRLDTISLNRKIKVIKVVMKVKEAPDLAAGNTHLLILLIVHKYSTVQNIT